MPPSVSPPTSSPRRSECPTQTNRGQALKAYKQRGRYRDGYRRNLEAGLGLENGLKREALREPHRPWQHSEQSVRPGQPTKAPGVEAAPKRPEQEAPARLDVARMFNEAVHQAKSRPGYVLTAACEFASSHANTRVEGRHTKKAVRSLTVLSQLVEALKNASPATACTRRTALGKTRIDYALFRKLSAESQLATALEYVIRASRPQAGDTPRSKASTILNGMGSASLGGVIAQLMTRPFMPAGEMKRAREKMVSAEALDAPSLQMAKTTLAMAAQEGQAIMAGTAADLKALVQIATYAESVLRNVARHNTDHARARLKSGQAAASVGQAATNALQLASTLRQALTELGESIAADDWAFQRQAREYAAAAQP